MWDTWKRGLINRYQNMTRDEKESTHSSWTSRPKLNSDTRETLYIPYYVLEIKYLKVMLIESSMSYVTEPLLKYTTALHGKNLTTRIIVVN